MLVTTRQNVEGKRIVRDLGIVAGEAVLNTRCRVFRDVFGAAIPASSRGDDLRLAREVALQEIQQEATALGGNAVVGVEFEYAVVGDMAATLLVSASGSAVYTE